MSTTQKHVDNLASLRTDKEMLQIGIGELAAIIFMMIWAALLDRNNDSYSGVHHGLFAIILMQIIALTLTRTMYIDILWLFVAIVQGREKMKIGDWGLFCSFMSILLIPIAILFILDISFISSMALGLVRQ